MLVQISALLGDSAKARGALANLEQFSQPVDKFACSNYILAQAKDGVSLLDLTLPRLQ